MFFFFSFFQQQSSRLYFFQSMTHSTLYPELLDGLNLIPARCDNLNASDAEGVTLCKNIVVHWSDTGESTKAGMVSRG